jgi:hypothetical protein
VYFVIFVLFFTGCGCGCGAFYLYYMSNQELLGCVGTILDYSI